IAPADGVVGGQGAVEIGGAQRTDRDAGSGRRRDLAGLQGGLGREYNRPRERRPSDMRTHIEGGWVVAFNGRTHEVHEAGSVVFEDERIVHAGPAYTGPADTRIAARGQLVSPGFINTRVHSAGTADDYLLLDMAKNDYRSSNYMSFAAPLKGKMTPPPAAAVAAVRAYVFLHPLKNGTTTIIDVGGP